MTSLARLPFRRLVRRLRRGSVAWLHAAGPQLRPALQALQSRDLLAQCGVPPRERGDLLEQLDDQLLQLVEAKIIDI